MELTTPFQLAQRLPSFEPHECESAAHSSSPQRVVGFSSSESSGGCSRSPSSVLQDTGSPRERADSCKLGSGMCRQGSLGQQLRKQQLQQQQQLLPSKLSIRTKSGSIRGQTRDRLGRARSTQVPQLPAEAQATTRASELLPQDATVPRGAGVALVRQQSNSVEIPRLQNANTCPVGLGDDLIAAALHACDTTHLGQAAPSPARASNSPQCCNTSTAHFSPGTAPSAAPRDGKPAMPWGAMARCSGAAGSLCGERETMQRACSTQEQLFAAHADAAHANARVQCLHEALSKEQEEMAILRAQLRRMTLERDDLRRMGAAAAGHVTTSAPAMQELQRGDFAFGGEGGGAEFTTPFGGFSPFTPGRGSP